ncbi:MAG: hypothetical protein WBG92_03730 [Thiohalocapsa sp.]
MKPITNEQFSAFLNEKTPKGCPYCGHDAWVTSFGEESDKRLVSAVAPLMAPGDRFDVPAKRHMMFALVCKNCGDVRQIARYVIEDWVDEKDNEG